MSLVSLYIAFNTSSLQLQKAKEDSDAAQAKQFADLIQAAADSNRGAGERIAAIWLLQRYWQEPKRTDVVANALCGIIADENNVSVMAACAEVIGHAYSKDTPLPIRQSLKKLLFGEVRRSQSGEFQVVVYGAVLRAQNLVLAKATPDPKTNGPVEERQKYLCEAIQDSLDDLEGVNFYKARLANLNLERASLARAYLYGADLTGADLSEADLREAILDKAHLEKSSLVRAHLEGAQLMDISLNEADLTGAYLEGANFAGIDLTGARLLGAHLNGVDLGDAKLEGVRLDDAYLEGAHLGSTSFIGDNPERKNLKGAHFVDAHLNGASLKGTDLENAFFAGADLRGPDLTKTNLKGAILVKANLTGTKLDGADLDGAWVDDLNDLKDVLGTFQGKVKVVREN